VLGYIFAPVGVIALVFGILLLVGKSSTIDNLQRVALSRHSGTVTFDDSGGYVAYYEAAHIDPSALPPLGVTLIAPSGRRIAVTTPYGNRTDGRIDVMTYHHGGADGVALYEFSIDETGTYRVDLEPSGFETAGASMAFGESIAGSQLGGTLLVILGTVALVAALVLLIIGFVRRAGHKRRITEWQRYYYPAR
jgi:hypothetical protein